MKRRREDHREGATIYRAAAADTLYAAVIREMAAKGKAARKED